MIKNILLNEKIRLLRTMKESVGVDFQAEFVDCEPLFGGLRIWDMNFFSGF